MLKINFMRKSTQFLLLSCLLAWGSLLQAQTLVSTQAENKKVILEEFTGANCPNCPAAHTLIDGFLNTYAGQLFTVGYHPFNSSYTTPQNSSDPDMRRSFSDIFYNTTFTMGTGRFMPSGFVNRRNWAGGRLTGRSNWSGHISTILAEPSPVNVGVLATYDTSNTTLTVNVEVYYTDSTEVANTLYVILMESGIVAAQSGGSSNYVHKHVFRESLTTDQWGDLIPISSSPGQLHAASFTFDNSAGEYDMENCSVMAFVRDPSTEEIFSGTGAEVTEPVNNTNIDEDILSTIVMETFPNPADQFAQVRFTLRSVEEIQFELFNLNGKLISTTKAGTFSAGTHLQKIDLSTVAKGMYVLKLSAGEQVGMTRLFVK